MAPESSARSNGDAKPGGKGKTQRPKTVRIRRSDTKKTTIQKKKAKVAEVTVSHETLVRRVKDARGTALVVLGARAIGGAVITILAAACVVWLLLYAVLRIESKPLLVLLNLAGAAGLVFAAHLTSVGSVPEAASGLAFLQDRAFVWVDPFRDEKPHLLPFWLEVILWAPAQVLAGAYPFLRVKKTEETDAEAAAGIARRMVEEGEVGVTKALSGEGAEARGLRLLLLLRLARLLIEDGKVKAKVSGLGQTALFEGSVG